MSTTVTIPEQIGAGVSSGVGRILIAPAIAAALDAPDTRSAIRDIAWSVGIPLGVCIAGGIVLGHMLKPSKKRAP